MNFTKTLLLLVLFLAAATTDAARLRTPQSRVWNICKNTTKPVLCYKTVLPQALLPGRFNIYKAVGVTISAAQKQVQKTIALMNSLIAAPGTSKSVADSLSYCKHEYEDFILDDIAAAVAVLAKRDVVTARLKFSAVVSYNQGCEGQFEDDGPLGSDASEPSPITADTQAVKDHAFVCLEILAAIEEKEKRRHGGVIPVVTTNPDFVPCC